MTIHTARCIISSNQNKPASFGTLSGQWGAVLRGLFKS